MALNEFLEEEEEEANRQKSLLTRLSANLHSADVISADKRGHQARECPPTISEDNAMRAATSSALDVTSFSMLDKAEDETITLNADELQKNAEWYKRVIESSPVQFVIRDEDVGIRLLPLSSDSSALTTESDND